MGGGEARYAAGVRTGVDRLATAGPAPDAALALLRLGEVELALGQARALAARGRPAGTAVAYALAAVGGAAGDADLCTAARLGVEDVRVAAALAETDPSWWETVGRVAAVVRDRGAADRPFRRGGSARLADWMLSLHHLAAGRGARPGSAPGWSGSTPSTRAGSRRCGCRTVRGSRWGGG